MNFFHSFYRVPYVRFVVTDMNECQRTGMCTNGQCINIDGGYRCQCDHGFQESSGGTACIGDLVFH